MIESKLATPIKEGGETINTEVSQIVWTWTGPLGKVSNAQFINFPLSLAIPEGTAGKALEFKTVQTYSNGQVVHWIEPSLTAEHPSPRINVTSKGGVIQDIAGHEAGPEAGQSAAGQATPAADDDQLERRRKQRARHRRVDHRWARTGCRARSARGFASAEREPRIDRGAHRAAQRTSSIPRWPAAGTGTSWTRGEAPPHPPGTSPQTRGCGGRLPRRAHARAPGADPPAPRGRSCDRARRDRAADRAAVWIPRSELQHRRRPWRIRDGATRGPAGADRSRSRRPCGGHLRPRLHALRQRGRHPRARRRPHLRRRARPLHAAASSRSSSTSTSMRPSS